MALDTGDYYIGDPCYALSTKVYDDEFIPLIVTASKILDGEFSFPDGVRFACYSTMYGDGHYPSNIRFAFPVDAGCLSAIPVGKCDPTSLAEAIEGKLGMVVTFDAPFNTSFECGQEHVVFGHIVITTGDDEDPYDPDYD